MAIERGYGGETFGERLPWLEPVEEEDYADHAGGFGKLILALVVVMVLIGGAIGGFLWWRDEQAHAAAIGSVIHADPGPYKTKPADPGGMQIASAGAVAERTSIGGDINSPLDLAAIPEAPVTGPGSAEGAGVAAPAQPDAPAVPSAPSNPNTPTAKAVTITTVPPAPMRAPIAAVARAPIPAVAPPAMITPTGAAGSIQLGAFSTEAKAQGVWKTLAKRFGYLAGLSESVQPVASGGSTLYRLRASGPGAAKACAQLKVAGETCSVV